MTSFLIDESDAIKNMEIVDHHVRLQNDIAADHIINEIENKTFPYVPLDEGYLQDSFYTKITSPTPVFQADMFYSMLSNKYFDYAEVQHEVDFNHPLKGEIYYMKKGIAKVDELALYAYHISKAL